MKIAGIIAEYNPFHNGHAYHLGMTRERSDAVIAVMSGNYVQRAEPAVMSKFARAEAATECGVDLVIELPVSWSMATAQRFSQGAVGLLDSLGCVDILSFGSECADLPLIMKTAQAVDSQEVSDYIKANLGTGSTYASVRENAVRELYSDSVASVLSRPNDILGVEYCRELLKLNSDIVPCPIKRINAEHDSKESLHGFASASLIRSMIKKGESVEGLMPAESYSVLKREIESRSAPASITNIERSILLRLRQMDPSDLSAYPDVSEGIENRIIEAAKKSGTLEELFDTVKTKRYTHSRIRRIVMSAYLDVMNEADYVPYARVLAFNKTGADILKIAKKTSQIPIITKKSDLDLCDETVKNVFEAERYASEVYAMMSDRVLDYGMEFTKRIYKKGL